MQIIDRFQRWRTPSYPPEYDAILILINKHRECFESNVESFTADCFKGGEPVIAFEGVLTSLQGCGCEIDSEDRDLIRFIGRELELAESEWNIWDYEIATLADGLRILPQETDEDRELVRRLRELATKVDPTKYSLNWALPEVGYDYDRFSRYLMVRRELPTSSETEDSTNEQLP